MQFDMKIELVYLQICFDLHVDVIDYCVQENLYTWLLIAVVKI